MAETKQTLIAVNPRVMMGKPILAGTRSIFELAAGTTVEQLLEMHPTLSREGIVAALEYAADAVRYEVIYPTPKDEDGASA